jgi:hypothetical protein
VLKPDGKLLFLEHGRSSDPAVARRQDRWNGAQRVIGCGCNLNRPIAALVEAAGFRFETVQTMFAPGMPRTHGWITSGTARLQ